MASRAIENEDQHMYVPLRKEKIKEEILPKLNKYYAETKKKR